MTDLATKHSDAQTFVMPRPRVVEDSLYLIANLRRTDCDDLSGWLRHSPVRRLLGNLSDAIGTLLQGRDSKQASSPHAAVPTASPTE